MTILDEDCSPKSVCRAIDTLLNKAIREITEELLPDGFDVADDAPTSFAELTAWMGAGHRMRVWSGASDHTIFGDPQTNYYFRAWHDYLHWRHGLAFDLPGEAAVAQIQGDALASRAPDLRTSVLWRALVYSEVLGQVLAEILQGRFPANQRVFTRDFLNLFFEPQASALELDSGLSPDHGANTSMLPLSV